MSYINEKELLISPEIQFINGTKDTLERGGANVAL